MIKEVLNDSGEEAVVNRRRIMQMLGSGTVGFATVGSSSRVATATALEREIDSDGTTRSPTKTELSQLRDRYSSVSAATAAIDDYATKLLEELNSQGIIDGSFSSRFGSYPILTKSDFHEGKEGIFVAATVHEGTSTARITVREKTAEHVVKLFVHPEADDHYAVVESSDGSRNPRYFSSGDQIGTEGHCDYIGTYCTSWGFPCWGVANKYKYYYCGTDCKKGEHVECCCCGGDDPCSS